VDFGMGNLFSVKQACEWAGLTASITQSPAETVEADAVVLPGVGAFANAMAMLNDLGMVDALREVAASERPLVGICLGMQLLMTESQEFGCHAGLDIVPGAAVWLESGTSDPRTLKRPQICWNQLRRVRPEDGDSWAGTFLEGLPNGTAMYFLHSLCVRPSDDDLVVATTRYGTAEFCSALQYRNIFACQCHPERSGVAGLQVYCNLARVLFGRAKRERMRGARR